MWKKYQSRFSADYVVEAQRAKEMFQTTVGPNQIDVRGEDNVIYRTRVNADMMYGNSPGVRYWLMRKGEGLTPTLWSDEYVTNNWQVYLEPPGVTTPVPLSASKTWREYYHRNNPKQRVVIQDIYKISLIEESNVYRVEGVDGVIYTVPALISGDDYSLEHCKLVKTVHPNGNFYYSLLPGSSFGAFYHPVDGDPQPVNEPEVAHVKPSEPDPMDVLYSNTADAGTMLLPVNQTLQFVTIFSAALSALIQTRDPNNHNPRDLVKCAYEYAKLSTEKLCGPQ